MSFGDYLFVVVGLALVAVPIAMAGVRLRRRLLPGWIGAPARVGREEWSGNFVAIAKCRPWRRALNAGGYDYVVTTPGLDLNQPEETSPSPERGWLGGDPNATEVLRSGRVAVFELSGPVDPRHCGR